MKAIFDGAFAWNVKFIAYVWFLRNLHGATVQLVIENSRIVPNSDPQSLYGVAVHTKFTEQDNNPRRTNENISVCK